MVECLNCGLRRELPEHECQRCSYLGWTLVPTAQVRRLERRSAQPVHLARRLHAV